MESDPHLVSWQVEKETSRPALADSGAPHEAWELEREKLLELLAHQQRLAQAGLVTAGLAHDVNNFVQVMLGITFLALESPDPQAWKEALQDVQSRGVGLSEIARSFQSFVKRRDGVEGGRFLLSTVVEQAARLVRPLAARGFVDLEPVIEEDGEVLGESRLAIQAVVNLASNATRACASTNGGGRVTLTVSRPLPNLCRICVSDNGPGIPDELRASLFRPFTTGHENDGGNGIGLFIVRQAVLKLHGSIRVRTSSRGTTFAIDLPTA